MFLLKITYNFEIHNQQQTGVIKIQILNYVWFDVVATVECVSLIIHIQRHDKAFGML